MQIYNKEAPNKTFNKGDYIYIGELANVTTVAPMHFFYDNCKGTFELEEQSAFITSSNDFSYLIGVYVITDSLFNQPPLKVRCHGHEEIHSQGSQYEAKKLLELEEDGTYTRDNNIIITFHRDTTYCDNVYFYKIKHKETTYHVSESTRVIEIGTYKTGDLS